MTKVRAFNLLFVHLFFNIFLINHPSHMHTITPTTITTLSADLEGSINIICHLVGRISPPDAATAAKKLSFALASQTTIRPDRRLQALVNLYNVVSDSPSKIAVLLEILAYSKASGLADIILGIIRANADSWAESLQLDKAQERQVYAACADALSSCTRKPKTAAKETYRLLSKHLETFRGTDAATAATATPIARRMVIDFIKSPDMFYFDLADSPAVAALASDAETASLHQLLTIYLSGSVAEFKQFAAKNVQLFEETLEISLGDAETKMKLLALMGLANRVSEIAFADIASSLDIDISEVEGIVVQSIGKKLLDGRIDQLKRAVTVNKCLPRTFGMEQWRQLQGQLRGWKESIAHVQQLGTDEKDVLPRGIAELTTVTV